VELATKYTVYRLYDANDELLYVGCTKHITPRLEKHSKREWWYEVARIEETSFDDPAEAADAEEHFYFTEAPRYNGKRHSRYRAPRGWKSQGEQRTKTPSAFGVDGAKIRRLRLHTGVTQIELAERAGVGHMTISRIERGEIEEPRISTLRKLADALGIQVRDLLED
jgi:DNA-binding XRE family transcriptional regulator